MNNFVELPLLEPMYSTYHQHSPGTAIIVDNPSIRNFHLNEVMSLMCTRKFLNGFTTPQIDVKNSYWDVNPYLEKEYFPMRFLDVYVNFVIKNLLSNGYYVQFENVDDFYIEGKSWYKERHQGHGGLICGYNENNKTYCIYAYDQTWVYRKFWIRQEDFNIGIKSMFEREKYGFICGIKPKDVQVKIQPQTILDNILEYLDSSFERYPENEQGEVYGIIVHEYIAKYLDKLYSEEIPYNRMDRRVFRMIWEHKKAMLERIEMIEKTFSWDSRISEKYKSIVTIADNMRMLYASHHIKKRYSVLPTIKKMLIKLMCDEKEILNEFATKLGEELKK